jgi:hypothetical protein
MKKGIVCTTQRVLPSLVTNKQQTCYHLSPIFNSHAFCIYSEQHVLQWTLQDIMFQNNAQYNQHNMHFILLSFFPQKHEFQGIMF